MASRIKKGDTVMVISGKDKGKKGKVINVLDRGVIIEKMNVAKKHQKPTKTFPGGIIEKPMPVKLSKVMLICAKCGEPARVRFSEIEGKSVRKCVSCNEIMDKVK